MSYEKNPRFYVYSDGENMHLWVRYPEDNFARRQAKHAGFINGVAIPLSIFDEIVAARAQAEGFREFTYDPEEGRRTRSEWYGTEGHEENACGCVMDTEFACSCPCHPQDYLERDIDDAAPERYQE